MLDQLAYMLGGRVAEELVFHDPTTGAANDIEKATVGRPRDGHAVRHERAPRCDQARARTPARSSSVATWATSATTPRTSPRSSTRRSGRSSRRRTTRPGRSSSTTATCSTRSSSSCSRRRRSTRRRSPDLRADAVASSPGSVLAVLGRSSGVRSTAGRSRAEGERGQAARRAVPNGSANGSAHGRRNGRTRSRAGRRSQVPVDPTPGSGRASGLEPSAVVDPIASCPDRVVPPFDQGRAEAAVRELLHRGRRGPRPRGPARHPGPGGPDVRGGVRRSAPAARGRAHHHVRPRATTSWSSSGHRGLEPVRAPPGAVPRAAPTSATSPARTGGSPACRSWPGWSMCSPSARRCRSG